MSILLMVLIGLSGLCLLANIVLYVMVLVKLFKTKGVLHGILGLICEIYTFVWGWVKHKQLEITKIMAIWTITIIVPILIQIVAVFAGMSAMMLSVADQVKKTRPSPSAVVKKPIQKPGGKTVAAKRPGQRPSPARTPAAKSAPSV